MDEAPTATHQSPELPGQAGKSTGKIQRRRKGSHDGRRKRAQQGKRLVIASLVTALLFYLTFFSLAAADMLMGAEAYMPHSVISWVLLTTVFLLSMWLGVSAYRRDCALRQLFVLLNFVGATFGVFWLGLRFTREAVDAWALLEAIGIATALFVCWTFFCSRRVQSFFQEQEFTVIRK
jgi:cation transport ATPase